LAGEVLVDLSDVDVFWSEARLPVETAGERGEVGGREVWFEVAADALALAVAATLSGGGKIDGRVGEVAGAMGRPCMTARGLCWACL
jgi:hypothetical protein